MLTAAITLMGAPLARAADPEISASTKVEVDTEGTAVLSWVLTLSPDASDTISLTVIKQAVRGYTTVASVARLDGSRGELVLPGVAIGDKVLVSLARGATSFGGRAEFTAVALSSVPDTTPKIAVGTKVTTTGAGAGLLTWVLTREVTAADSYTIKISEKGSRAVVVKTTTEILEGKNGSISLDDVKDGMTYRLELLKDGVATGSITDVSTPAVSASTIQYVPCGQFIGIGTGGFRFDLAQWIGCQLWNGVVAFSEIIKAYAPSIPL